MDFLLELPPRSLHPAACHAGHQFSYLKGKTKSYWLLDLDTTQYLVLPELARLFLPSVKNK